MSQEHISPSLLAGLTAVEMLTLRMRRVDGMKDFEIAAALGISRETANRRIQRALAKIRIIEKDPNTLLAAEVIAAIHEYCSAKRQPVTVPREGFNHDPEFLWAEWAGKKYHFKK